MHILWATIIKDFKILLRDRVGLFMMFFMPILFVVVITSVQNSTFELVNNNKISLVIYNNDNDSLSLKLINEISKIGLFKLQISDSAVTENKISSHILSKDALVALVIPKGFTKLIKNKAEEIATRSLSDPDSLNEKSTPLKEKADSLKMYYNPVMQASFRHSVDGALNSAVQVIQGEAIVKKLYEAVNQKEIPQDLEKQILFGQFPISEIPLSSSGNRTVPNASQHNVPAWTIFAMFFIVISLGGVMVREKNSGSFIRLKTLPASYMNALFSKQFVYLLVTFLQATVVFLIGNKLFPYIGLPALNLPADIWGLLTVTIVCGYCAVSYAICVGVFANTPEQSNGFGAISILILAALGGLLVPSFAMPANLQKFLSISPLHWALEAYYGLFLVGGKLKDIWMNILSLLGITALIQLFTLYGLKKKNLI
ncbi:MAG TPA: ABC transporter permease [Puia sp.]|nr:ABC transporter permease [Puia sp.]